MLFIVLFPFFFDVLKKQKKRCIINLVLVFTFFGTLDLTQCMYEEIELHHFERIL